MGDKRRRETLAPARPAIEALEGRVVPATFHAANVAQLQADIAAVNNTTGPNTIVLAPGNYNLATELRIENATGLTIQGTTTTKGKAANLVSAGLGRLIEIDGGTVTISNVTLSGGNTVAQGAGIYAQNANLTVTTTSISGNIATQAGGGIFAQGGKLDVEKSTISSNTAQGGASGFGGGIATVNAAVTIANTTINGNTVLASSIGPQAAATGNGGGIGAQGGTLSVTATKIVGNAAIAATSGPNAQNAGGAVWTTNAVVSMTRSTITGNRLSTVAGRIATPQGSVFSTMGGSLTISGSKIAANSPNGTYNFDHPGATVVIENSSVDGKQIAGKVTLKS
jgi:hypothetical protein